MKGLFLDVGYYRYFKFPEGFNCIRQLIEYANSNYNSFITMTELHTDNCRPPYFIEEETETVFVNISKINSISEIEIAGILPKREYEERLKKIVAEKCVHCSSYEEETDPDGDNLSGHRNRITLDGECYGFRGKKTDDILN